MQKRAGIFKKEQFSKVSQPPGWWSGLQARMTISYVGVTVVSVLLLEMLVLTILLFFAFSSLSAPIIDTGVKQEAVQYALEASRLAQGETLNPQSTFQPHQAGSLVIRGNGFEPATHNIQYTSQRYPDTQQEAFALLISPNGQIVASSYPARYPLAIFSTTLPSDRDEAIAFALSGTLSSGVSSTPAGRVGYAAAPVWSKDNKPIGAIYVEVPATPPIVTVNNLWEPLRIPLVSALVLLVITVPIGGLFGAISTRSLVRRIHRLATATTRFTDGDYAQRVHVAGKDEVGQLEAQFNRMAEQLIESINRRQELAEQNARLGERDRISRELHDAISQDLFSLHMLAGGLQTAFSPDSPLYPQIKTLKQTAQTMIFEMRALLLELRPAQLEHLGLPAALEDLATAYRSRLGIEVVTTIQPVTLPSHVEHALLRIAQEALSNAARHAEASKITLALEPQERTVTLTVIDNGKGFALEDGGERSYSSLGLRTMHERVQELHGSFELKSAPGQGTSIHICLPREEEGV
ncbi:MAG: HAMP domain-containing protein [Ktedonobacteraceae bacterium]|nr:HAMP domain-containing protein [Ktedonobacteraceae bacterium]